jgi:Ca2+-binding RTX toxin-like protein
VERMVLLAALALVSMAALPAAAGASVQVRTEMVSGQSVVVAVDDDGASDVRMTYEEEFLSVPTHIRVRNAAGATAAAGCNPTADPLVVECPGEFYGFVFFGNGGNDKLEMELLGGLLPALHGEAYGAAGDDTLRAPPTLPAARGETYMEGEAGNDTLISGAGGNTLKGGDGNDDIRAYDGTDEVFGESGDDTLRGGLDTVADVVDGGPGFDQIPDSGTDYNRGMAKDVSVTIDGQPNDGEAGEGDNVLAVEKLRIRARTVTFVGSEGADDVLVEAQSSSIKGLGGNDRLRGYDGIDTIDGGEGDDYLEGGFGDDSITGGGGTDSFMGDSTERNLLVASGNDKIFARDGLAEPISCGVGSDTAQVDASDRPDATCETVDGRGGGDGFGPKTRVTIGRGKVAGGVLSLVIANANPFAVTGRISGATTKAVATAKKRKLKLKAKSFSVGANAKKTVKLRLGGALKRLLKRRGKLTVRLSVRVGDPAGNVRIVTKKAVFKRKR